MKLRALSCATRRSDPALPLINLALLLMVFFLLVGSLGSTLPADWQAPQSRAQDVAAPGAHGLWLDAQGRAWLDGRALTDEALASAAQRWAQAHPQAALPVHADARAPAQRLLRVLDALRAAGVAHAELLGVPETP